MRFKTSWLTKSTVAIKHEMNGNALAMHVQQCMKHRKNLEYVQRNLDSFDNVTP